MHDVPNSCGVLAFSPAHGKPLALGVGWEYFVPVFNGSGFPGMAGRNMDATWRSLSALCRRETEWSKPRLVYGAGPGKPFKTYPPGHEAEVDWHHPETVRTLDIEGGSAVQTVLMADGLPNWWFALGIEVLPADGRRGGSPRRTHQRPRARVVDGPLPRPAA